MTYYFGPTAHVLRVSLHYVEPEVWRRITVVSEIPLPKFAKVLEHAMGWEGYHLHMFDVGGVLFGLADEDADHLLNEKAAKLTHVLPRVESSLRWSACSSGGPNSTPPTSNRCRCVLFQPIACASTLANFGNGMSDTTTIRRHTSGSTKRSDTRTTCAVGPKYIRTPPRRFCEQGRAAR